MTAIGIDLGGTKIEAQVFDDTWKVRARKRIATARDYPTLLADLVTLIQWAEAQSGAQAPIGIGAAGLLHPDTGQVFAANLPASDQSLPADIAQALGRPITYLNDCRALALSEAVFGAGKDHRTVLALVLGTGIGGGIAVNGTLLQGPSGTGGEFGHTSAPAHLVAQHNLPLVQCGCGRMGCIETYIAGPGLSRLAKHLTGQDLTAPEIAAQRHTEMKQVWNVWCALTADLLHSLTLTIDPDIIVLGGGLSQIDGVVEALSKAAQQAQFDDFSAAPIALAQGGDSSGARGAAFAAWQAQND